MHKQEKFKDANFELNTINSKNGNQILDAEREPKIERPRTSEGKLHFVIDISTDKKQLLELRKILIELEFNNYEKEGGKKIIENDERKIRRR